MNVFQGSAYKWWAFLALAIGLFASVADHGSVIVALPSIADHFQTDLTTTQWIVLGYALAISALLMPMGRLADMVGRKRIYLLGFVIFVVGAGVAGASPNVTVLILAKIFQGVGSAMTQGTSMAMIVATFPAQERGRSLGLQMSVVGIGGVAGPAVGGFLVGAFDWRWVFYGNMFLGAIALVAAWVVLDARREGQAADSPGAFDWLGATLSAGALLSFLLGMTWGPRIGWDHPGIAIAMGLTVFQIIGFAWWQLHAPMPMMDVRLFRSALFSLSVAAFYISFLGMSAVRFLMPFYLQAVLGYSPAQVGLVIVPGAIAIIITGPLAGRLSDRYGWRPFTVGGMAICVAGLLTLTRLQTDSPLWVAIAGMVMQSFGSGTLNAPNNSAVLSTVPQSSYGVMSGFLNLVRNTGNVTSIAMMTALVTATMGSMGYAPTLSAVTAGGGAGVLEAFTTGLRDAYFIVAMIVTLGVAASFFSGVRRVKSTNSAPVELASGDGPD